MQNLPDRGCSGKTQAIGGETIKFFESPSGDELSWLSPTLGLWVTGMTMRDTQYREWIEVGQPVSFWMGGFFNSQVSRKGPYT